MQAKELADLADTTVRTVRYYHQIGLLPIPPVKRGVRDYDVYHLARLLRIRWLADAGVPLHSIHDLLEVPSHGRSRDTAEELRQALASVDARIAALSAQRDSLLNLIDQAGSGRLTPLPRVLANLYDRLAASMPNAAARHAVEGERSVVVFLAVHGLLPDGFTALAAQIDQDDEVEAVRLFDDLARLADLDGPEADDLIEELVVSVRQMYRKHAEATDEMLAELPRGLAGKALWSMIARLAHYAFAAPSQQRLLDAMARALSAEPGIRDALAESRHHASLATSATSL